MKTMCKSCLVDSFLPPGVFTLIDSFLREKKEQEHLSNLITHGLTTLPSPWKPCPCHCPHYTCNVCCLELLTSAAQEKLFSSILKNNEEAKRLKEMKKLKRAALKKQQNQKRDYRVQGAIPKRKTKTRSARRQGAVRSAMYEAY